MTTVRTPSINSKKRPRLLAGEEPLTYEELTTIRPEERAQVEAMCPHLYLVPRELEANLLFREQALGHGRSSKRAGDELWNMCRQDPVFFFNVFLWTYAPDYHSKQPEWPFITWEFQDVLVERVTRNMGLLPDTARRATRISKVRDMGASWCCVGADMWAWLFYGYTSFLWTSRKTDYVDKTGDPKSLFWKARFILDRLPSFLLPRYHYIKLHLTNLDNGATIDGESTTEDTGRGGHVTGSLRDEHAADPMGMQSLAAGASTTQSEVWNSTTRGIGTAFHALGRDPQIEHIYLHWTRHPGKCKGLYYDNEGVAQSPWTKRMEAVLPNKVLYAQEVEGDDTQAGGQYFDARVIQRHKDDHATPPLAVGDMEYGAGEKAVFCPAGRGAFSVWGELDSAGGLPRDSYTIGIDVSGGVGASDSTMAIASNTTGLKVAEFASNYILPTEFAALAVATARWAKNEDGGPAFMAWEANGPGGLFGEAVQRLGFSNYFFQRREDTVTRRQSDKPGWWSDADSKLRLIGMYAQALRDDTFINPSEVSLYQCLEYVQVGGAIVHMGSLDKTAKHGAGQEHGDRVIADALCCMITRERRAPKQKTIETAPANSLAGRRRAYLAGHGDEYFK